MCRSPAWALSTARPLLTERGHLDELAVVNAPSPMSVQRRPSWVAWPSSCSNHSGRPKTSTRDPTSAGRALGSPGANSSRLHRPHALLDGHYPQMGVVAAGRQRLACAGETECPPETELARPSLRTGVINDAIGGFVTRRALPLHVPALPQPVGRGVVWLAASPSSTRQSCSARSIAWSGSPAPRRSSSSASSSAV